MSRIAYVNGHYFPHGAASVHIEDRGYQFADGVYEVIAVRGGGLIDSEWHMERLKRSLSELQIDMPMSVAALCVVLRETVRRNRDLEIMWHDAVIWSENNRTFVLVGQEGQAEMASVAASIRGVSR